MEIQNNQECFVLLWRMMERTRRLLAGHCKRFCIRNILKAWFGSEATDDFIWEVCRLSEQEGWNELPIPSLYPLKHRELLRAVVAVRLGISFYKKVNLKALDKAYSEAFPNSTPINKKTEKKVRQGEPELTTSKKLDQIKTGAKIKRQTGGTEKKEVIIGGKNGAKTVVHETEEKFEETAVLRKKRNY